QPQIVEDLETAVMTGRETEIETVADDKSILVAIFPFQSTLFGSSNRRGVAMLFVDRAAMEKRARQTFLFSTAIMTMGMGAILLVMGLSIQNTVLRPLRSLDRAVDRSKQGNNFAVPADLKAQEFASLAITFLDAYNRLQNEIYERRQAETALREKSHQLEQAILELQQTQSQLIQTEKMSSLGQLVAGIAHEINNPVGFIAGNIVHAKQYFHDFLRLFETYREFYPNPEPAIQDLMEEIDFDFALKDYQSLLISMQTGTNRIRDIVLSMRNFSRLDEADMKKADLHEGIDSTLLILQHRLKAKSDRVEIQVIKDYDRIPPIYCYPSQLNQVFMNLLSNAIDALEEQVQTETNFSPQINIRTEVRDRLEHSKSVVIRIADNGSGISQETQKRLFEPFFTTKPIGKGTGLGLSISYKIVVDRHKGRLVCSSQPNKGTEFEIEIPAHQKGLL
ncbi:MAG: sensor histidine kinase, partial [Spirulina sp.]